MRETSLTTPVTSFYIDNKKKRLLQPQQNPTVIYDQLAGIKIIFILVKS